MVGTAVYQVGCSWSIQSKKRGASKPGGQITRGPAVREASRPPMSPCTWNSGITSRHRSVGRNARLAAMLVAEAHRLAWLSATILGRDVVPDVVSTRAVSDPDRSGGSN